MLLGRDGTEREHEVDPRREFLEGLILNLARPENAGRFRRDQRGAFEDAAQLRIFFALKQHQRIAGNDMMRMARSEEVKNLIDRVLKGDGVNAAAENFKRQRVRGIWR